MILGGAFARGGCFVNMFAGEPADTNIGNGIMVLVGFTIAWLGDWFWSQERLQQGFSLRIVAQQHRSTS